MISSYVKFMLPYSVGNISVIFYWLHVIFKMLRIPLELLTYFSSVLSTGWTDTSRGPAETDQ
jgi:hypothetical protein